MSDSEPEEKFPAYGYLVGAIILGGSIILWVLLGDVPTSTAFVQGQVFGALELGALLCIILWINKR